MPEVVNSTGSPGGGISEADGMLALAFGEKIGECLDDLLVVHDRASGNSG